MWEIFVNEENLVLNPNIVIILIMIVVGAFSWKLGNEHAYNKAIGIIYTNGSFSTDKESFQKTLNEVTMLYNTI